MLDYIVQVSIPNTCLYKSCSSLTEILFFFTTPMIFGFRSGARLSPFLFIPESSISPSLMEQSKLSAQHLSDLQRSQKLPPWFKEREGWGCVHSLCLVLIPVGSESERNPPPPFGIGHRCNL